jgi:hypothetical protein
MGRETTNVEMLTFVVASFDIGYNCILGRPFLLKFMAVIHTAYVTLKMPNPKGVITIKVDQRDTLACENATLTHVGCFSKMAMQDEAAKVAKMQGGSTPLRSVAPSHQSPAPLDLLQQRKAHMLPHHLFSSSLISRQMTRRRGLITKRLWLTLAIRKRGFGLA